MASESNAFPALRGYLNWVKGALKDGTYRSVEQAKVGLHSSWERDNDIAQNTAQIEERRFGDSADSRSRLENECTFLRRVVRELNDGSIAPLVSKDAVSLPVVFSPEDMAFPGSPHAKEVAAHEACRAAFVLCSLPTSSGQKRYFSVLQYVVEAGLCRAIVDALFFVLAVVTMVVASSNNSVLLPVGLLFVLMGLRYESRLLASKLTKGRRVFSKFYALRFNPSWPIGAPSRSEKAGQGMRTQEWVYQCLAHAPWRLRGPMILTALLVIGILFGIPVWLQAICSLSLGSFVFLCAVLITERIRNSENRLEEMERGLDEMFDKDYQSLWLNALRPQDRRQFEEIFDVLDLVRRLGVPIRDLSAEGILGNVFRSTHRNTTLGYHCV